MRLPRIGLPTRITLWVLLFVVAGGVQWMREEERRQREIYLSDRSADLEMALEVEQARIRQNIETLRQDDWFLANVPPIAGIVRASANHGIDPRDNNTYATWEARLQEIFAAYLRAHPEYFQARYIGATDEGRELVRVDNINGQINVAPRESLQARGDRDYFKAGMMLTAGREHLSDFTLRQEPGKIEPPSRPTLSAVTTVFDPAGRVFGMVVIDRDMSGLFASAAVGLPSGVQSYIADQHGQYLLHPDHGHASAFEAGSKENIANDFPSLKPLFDTQTRQDELHFQAEQQGGGGYIAAKKVYFDSSDPSRYVLLVYHIPAQVVGRQFFQLFAPNLTATLLVMLLVGGLFMLILRHTFAPLKRIAASAREIAAGNRMAHLSEKAGGEIGELVEALNIMLDKLSDRELVKRESALRKSIIETSHDGYWLIDALGNLLEVNQAYADLSGYSMSELVGMHISQLEATERSADEVMAHIVKIIEQGYDVFETRHRRKDGDEIDVEVSATFLPDSQKFVAFCRDITERKKVQVVQQRYQKLIETAMDGYWMTDADGYLEEVNEAYARMSGYTMQELIGMHISDLEAKEVAEETREHIEKLMLKGYDRFETQHRRKDGRVVDIEIAATFVPDAEKIFVFCRNITMRKQAELEMRVAATAFETHEAILITDAQANIIRVNSAFTEITGFTAEEVLGKNPSLMSSGRQDKAFYAEMWRQLLENGTWAGEIWDRRKSGEIYPKWMTITAVKDERGATTQYVAIFSDITERKKAEEEIRNLAFYDPLTHLPNRRLFLERLHTALAASARYDDYGAVLFIDLDRFKVLNDTCGHDYGDLLLIEVAARIKACVREMDTVSRFGGDEFVVLLESISSDRLETSRKAGLVAEKIRAMLSRPYLLKDHEHVSTPSIGIALYHRNEESLDELLKYADIAMYRSKEAGRNAVRFYDAGLQQDWEARFGGESGGSPD